MGAPREVQDGHAVRHVVLVGPMGAGKTTLGQALAARLEMPFLDSDTELGSKYGRTGADIARDSGVPALHDIEVEVFIDMAGSEQQVVIAPAASVVDRDEGRRLLDEHFAVWIQVPPEVARTRRATGSHRRPIDTEEQQTRDESRRRWLESLADLEVDNTGPLDVVVAQIVEELRQSLGI